MADGNTHNVNKNCDKDGARHGGSVLRVLDATHELLVVVLEGEAEDGEDDDGEDGDDKAARRVRRSSSGAGPRLLQLQLQLS